MTRRSQVVRSSRGNGPSAGRPWPGGAIIWCDGNPCAQSSDDTLLLSSIPVVATDPFQRFAVAATVTNISAFWPGDPPVEDYYNIELAVDQSMGGLIASGMNLRQEHVTLTSAVDLVAGPHTIDLYIEAETFGNRIYCAGYTMYVIEGQMIEDPGCVGDNPT
jgi:hypothetical protein